MLGHWAIGLRSLKFYPVQCIGLQMQSCCCTAGRAEQESSYRQQLSHLHVPGKVFWTSAPLSDKLLNSLVAHCNGSFALYRNMGPNILLIGTSSGKLMRSVMCGSPVIASSFDSLRFVSQEGIGVQVCHPSEIPAAIQELTRNERAYREKCLSFATRKPCENSRAGKLCGCSKKQIDLRKGLPQQDPIAGREKESVIGSR